MEDERPRSSDQSIRADIRLRSGAAANFRHVSSTVEHPQYECGVVKGLENNQVVSVCAYPYRIAQVRTRYVAMRPVGNLLAVLPYLMNDETARPGLSSAT